MVDSLLASPDCFSDCLLGCRLPFSKLSHTHNVNSLAVTFVFIGVLYWIRTKQPNWLKPYWIALTVSVLAFGAVSYFYLNAPLERVLASTVLVLLSISLGYYIRVRPNVKINRAMYRGLGAVVLGFVLWFSLALILDVAGVPRAIKCG